MDNHLRDLLSEQRASVRSWLSALGVQTCQDVKHLWADAAAMEREWSNGPGKECSADLALEVADFYTRACRLALQDSRAQVRQLAGERESAYSAPKSEKRALPPVAARPQSKAKLLVPQRFVGPDVPVLTVSDSNATSAAATDERRQLKVRALFCLALDVFLVIAEIGLESLDMSDESAVARATTLAMVAVGRLSVRRIAALTATLKRWKTFCAQQAWSPRNLTPANVAAFLRSVSFGGPTAASAVFQALRWLHLNLAAPFPVDHFMIKPFRFHSLGHTSRQAAELQPWKFFNLLRIAAELTGTPRILMLFVLQAAVSCIRFAHFQRSVLHKDHGFWLEFECSEGKSRRKGVRPAYKWATPALKFGGVDLVAELRRFFQEELLPDTPFLWPAIRLRSDDLWQLTEDTPFLLDRKLSGPRFLDLFRGALCRCGLQPAQASVAGFNRLRRFLPTGAQMLDMSPQDCQAVGSWVELPSGGASSASAPKHTRTDLMSTHYSGERVLAVCALNPVWCRLSCSIQCQRMPLTPRFPLTPLGGLGS